MKRILKNKFIIIMLIFIILTNSSFNFISYGIEKSDIHLQKIGQAPYHLKYYREDRDIYSYIVCSIVGYYKDGNFYPAYCMNRDLPGAESQEYDVYINEVLKNDAVWRIVKNGYPYKSYKEMGLSSKEDAFVVTKMAIYCILGQSNINYFIADENDLIGIKMLEVLRNLVNIGLNGSEIKKDNIFNIEKQGELEKIDNFYYQNYKINTNTNVKALEIEILNNENIEIIEKSNSNFKIKIPEILISKDIDLQFKITGNVQNFPVFYGKTKIAGTQDYAVTCDGYSNIEQILESNISTNKSKIEISKVDKEIKLPIANTKIEIYKEDGTLIDSKFTDQDGKIVFDNLYTGKYILKEVEANPKYVLENKPMEVELNFNESNQIILENIHKKGNVEIVKYDKDNKNITLGGIEFELYNEKSELIGKFVTDLNGEIKISNLNIGKYTLKEIMAKNGYEISEDIEFEVLHNETTNIEISNEKEKGKIKVIKVDKDNNEIKLDGVEFIIIDTNNNIVDKLITDKNGEAESKLLPIYNEKYYLIETKTKDGYILNNEKIEFKLSSTVLKQFKIENETKKGKIKIKKIDFDTFKPIENVEFDIIDLETGKIIETIKTDKNGEAISSNLSINKKYKVIEKEKLEGYKVNTDEFEVNINWNEITELIITNEKEKGRVKIIKVDKDNDNIKLSGVKFELYNGDELLEVLETDENGEVYSKWLYSYNEKYYLIEIQGKEGYELNPEKIEFELKANETIELIIENNKAEEEIKKLPRTGY